MSSAPQLSEAEILAAIENGSRGPLRHVLAKLLLNGPTDEAIRAEAEKYPNRWYQNVQMASKGAGYRDGVDLDVSLTAKIAVLSDSELEAELSRLQGELDSQGNGLALQSGVNTGDNEEIP